MKSKYLLLLAFFSPLAVAAQTTEAAEAAPAVSSGNLLMDILTVVFIVTALVLLSVSLVLLKAFKAIAKEYANPQPFAQAEPVKALEYEEWLAQKKQRGPSKFWLKVLSLKPLEQEKDLELDHDFDDIKELNNPTPAWFMGLFYATILFSVVYLANYHVFGYGKLQDEEYAAEMAEAELQKQTFLAKAGNKIDENSVELDKSDAVLAKGATIYQANCVACHGDKGQGLVGPNLTDDYHLHGGSIQDIFKVVKYGVPEKGMIAWGKTLNAQQIAAVSNYLLSIEGSKPAGAKAPQGVQAR